MSSLVFAISEHFSSCRVDVPDIDALRFCLCTDGSAFWSVLNSGQLMLLCKVETIGEMRSCGWLIWRCGNIYLFGSISKAQGSAHSIAVGVGETLGVTGNSNGDPQVDDEVEKMPLSMICGVCCKCSTSRLEPLESASSRMPMSKRDADGYRDGIPRRGSGGSPSTSFWIKEDASDGTGTQSGGSPESV